MTTGYGNQYVRIWVDYNDDFNFTLDELILDNYVIAPMISWKQVYKKFLVGLDGIKKFKSV